MKYFLVTIFATLFLVVIANSIEQNNFNGRIINGHEAKPHSAPYIVSLKLLGATHSCGGSIIDKEWILTAAHCVGTGMGYISSAVAGLHKRIGLFETGVQRRTIDKVYIHEKFGKGSSIGPYDIALLHVRSPFEFNEYVQSISLPSAGKIHQGKVTLYGWGKTNANAIISLPGTLQTVTVNALPYNTCKEILPKNAPLHETNICSDSMQKGISACNGDSGGPLVEESSNENRELVGIVSWGFAPCGKDNVPSVYTRVSAYNEWIANKQMEYKNK